MDVVILSHIDEDENKTDFGAMSDNSIATLPTTSKPCLDDLLFTFNVSEWDKSYTVMEE